MPYVQPGGTGFTGMAQRKLNLSAIVMGLRWDAPQRDNGVPAADLDALCALFDARGRVLEIIHPGHPRSADGSVIHTGDSRDGAGEWDNERIFVFLQALPAHVTQLAFVVATVTNHPLNTVRGAACHVSDPYDDAELLRVDLTTLVGKKSHNVAVASRCPAGWRLGEGGPPDIRLHAAH